MDYVLVVGWVAGSAGLITAMRWVSSELGAWRALTRRFATTSTPLVATPERRVFSSRVLVLSSGAGVPGFYRHPEPLKRVAATPEGLQLDAGWFGGWRTRRVSIPWSEVRFVAQQRLRGQPSFELRLASVAHLHVDADAFDEIRPYLSEVSAITARAAVSVNAGSR